MYYQCITASQVGFFALFIEFSANQDSLIGNSIHSVCLEGEERVERSRAERERPNRKNVCALSVLLLWVCVDFSDTSPVLMVLVKCINIIIAF